MTLLNCDFTELLLYWTVTLLNCDFTELWLYWTVTLLNCDFTELLLYWTVTLLNCDFTELWLYWTVTLLNWLCWTVTLVYWAVTLLRCCSYIGSFWAKLPLTNYLKKMTKWHHWCHATELHRYATPKVSVKRSLNRPSGHFLNRPNFFPLFWQGKWDLKRSWAQPNCTQVFVCMCIHIHIYTYIFWLHICTYIYMYIYVRIP